MLTALVAVSVLKDNKHKAEIFSAVHRLTLCFFCSLFLLMLFFFDYTETIDASIVDTHLIQPHQ
jgi:hypothetical protein